MKIHNLSGGCLVSIEIDFNKADSTYFILLKLLTRVCDSNSRQGLSISPLSIKMLGNNEAITSPTLTNNSSPDFTHTPRRPSAFQNLARNEVPFSRPKLRDHCLACMQGRSGGPSYEKGTSSSLAKQRRKWVDVKKCNSPEKIYMRGSDAYIPRQGLHSGSSSGSSSSARGVIWKPSYKIHNTKPEFLKV